MRCISCYMFLWHDDVIKWKHFPRYWPFVRGIHRSPVNSPHKGQWTGALMFSLICVWINGWVNNRKAGDLGRYRARNDVIVMNQPIPYNATTTKRSTTRPRGDFVGNFADSSKLLWRNIMVYHIRLHLHLHEHLHIHMHIHIHIHIHTHIHIHDCVRILWDTLQIIGKLLWWNILVYHIHIHSIYMYMYTYILSWIYVNRVHTESDAQMPCEYDVRGRVTEMGWVIADQCQNTDSEHG